MYYNCNHIYNVFFIRFICSNLADAVYLDDENEREEYVMNETGRIWMGTVGKFSVRPWNFAQVLMIFLILNNENKGNIICVHPSPQNHVHISCRSNYSIMLQDIRNI